jgi:enoyl-[acyl-carrier protein] reductase II
MRRVRVDGLVVEGAEGGGFKNPEEVSTLVLLQGIRARTDVPMIAAGGICDGRGMARRSRSAPRASRWARASSAAPRVRCMPTTRAPLSRRKKPARWCSTRNRRRVRAPKSERTRAIHDDGLMAPDALKAIRDVYFHGDMEAAPALAGQSAGLSTRSNRHSKSSKKPWRSFSPSPAGWAGWQQRRSLVEASSDRRAR